MNLGDTHIEGVDVEAHYRWPRQSWGRLRVDVSGTYYIRYDVQTPMAATPASSPTPSSRR